MDDGCYTAVRIIAEMVENSKKSGKYFSLSDLIAALEEPAESVELRCAILAGRERMEEVAALAGAAVDEVAKETIDWKVEPVNYEGIRVRVEGGSGWCMLRPSLHEPIISVQIESDQIGGAKKIAKILSDGLQKRLQSGLLDLSSFSKL